MSKAPDMTNLENEMAEVSGGIFFYGRDRRYHSAHCFAPLKQWRITVPPFSQISSQIPN